MRAALGFSRGRFGGDHDSRIVAAGGRGNPHAKRGYARVRTGPDPWPRSQRMLTMAQPRILVVDDDTSIRSFVEMALDGEGYAVSTAMNGAQALTVSGQVQPDLILLDMRMPIMEIG